MTGYTTLAGALVAVGAKPFATTIQALRDNPLALAEADATAPVNQGNWHPYNKVTNGDANTGRFYDFATDGVVATRVTPDFVDGYEYKVDLRDLSHNSGAAQNLQCEAFRESGAAYNSASVLPGNFGGTTSWAGSLEMLSVRQAINVHYFKGWLRTEVPPYTNSGGAAPATLDLLNTVTTAQKITRLRFSFTAGSIDAGQMFLYRRRSVV